MKYLISYLISFLLVLHVFSQEKKKPIISFVPIYIQVADEIRMSSADTNAMKIGYIPWQVKNANNKVTDTVWMQENAFDAEDSKKWIFIGKAGNENKWYLYHEPISANNNSLKTWIRIRIPKLNRNKKTYLEAYELYLFEIDLINKKYKTIQNILYTAQGKKLGENSDEEDYQYPIPESLMETIVKILTDKYLKKKI